MMDDKKIIVNTQGGTVITGGTFSNVEFVAHKYVYNAEPKHEMECEGIEEADIVPCEAEPIEKTVSKKRSSGRSSEELFKVNRQERVTLFTDFLKEHHRFSTEVDTRKGNYVNKAFVAFYAQWMKAHLVPAQPNGNACYRFLKDDCGLSMKFEQKTYANFIRAYIVDADKDALGDVVLAVEEFLLKKN